MIESLKDDDIIRKVGGAFRFTAMVQRRLKELIEGSRPLIDASGMKIVEIAVEEIVQGKIVIDYEHSVGLSPPDEAEAHDQIHTADFTEIEVREIEED